MLELESSTRFRRDLKNCQKQQKDLSLLQDIIDTLRIQESLPPKNRDHPLTGNYANHRECHITSDWLLIYRVVNNILVLERTGSHSDLFR